MSKNGIWKIFTEQGFRELNNLEYLNYLLEKSHEVIKAFNKTLMGYYYWDLKEIETEEPRFYSKYKIVIDSEIATLLRLTRGNTDFHFSGGKGIDACIRLLNNANSVIGNIHIMSGHICKTLGIKYSFYKEEPEDQSNPGLLSLLGKQPEIDNTSLEEKIKSLEKTIENLEKKVETLNLENINKILEIVNKIDEKV